MKSVLDNLLSILNSFTVKSDVHYLILAKITKSAGLTVRGLGSLMHGTHAVVFLQSRTGSRVACENPSGDEEEIRLFSQARSRAKIPSPLFGLTLPVLFASRIPEFKNKC